jgi:toxin ParE1/3/4
MGAEIIWSPQAYSDLKAIHDYIARDSHIIAISFVERLLIAVDRLADFPLLGPRIREWKKSPYRHIVVPPYRIIYRADRKKGLVYLIAIVHGHRDLKRFLARRRRL